MSSVFFCEFGEFCKIREFGKICKIPELWETRGFRDGCSGTGHAIGHCVMRKIVLCISCFADLLVVVVAIFPLLSY